MPGAAIPLPLRDLHAAAGARWCDFAGWEMPRDYGSILAEHDAVRRGAALFDVSHMGRLVLPAPARIDPHLSRPLSDVADGRARYVLLLNVRATILDDAVGFRVGPEVRLVVNASRRPQVAAFLRANDVPFSDETEATALLALQGPRAEEILRSIVPEAARLARWGAGVFLDGFITRTGYTGEDGFEIATSVSAAPAVWRSLVAAGARPAGLGARDLARLEAGLPLYGHELDEETDPEEADLGWVLRTGRSAPWEAALAARRALPRRRRIGLLLDAPPAARGGEPVLSEDDRVIGAVTSGAPSPLFPGPIAMAFVAGPSAPNAVRVRNRRVGARVVDLPFYDSRKRAA